MATIDDFGGTTDPLNQPALGGPTGWAAAVRDYIKDLPAAIAGKVSKGGDTMTGALEVPLLKVPGYGQLIPGQADGELSLVNTANSAYAKLQVGTPVSVLHAATKGYVDTRVAAGVMEMPGGWSIPAGGFDQRQLTWPAPLPGDPIGVVIRGESTGSLVYFSVGANKTGILIALQNIGVATANPTIMTYMAVCAV